MAHPSEARLAGGANERPAGVSGSSVPGASDVPGVSDVPEAAGAESLEETLLEIWRQVLDRPSIGARDNLFTPGAHSLVPLVVGRIRSAVGVDVSTMDVLEAPTVAALTSVVAARTAAPRPASRARVVTPRPPDAEPVLSFDQRRLWMESQLLPGVVYNVHGRRRLVGPLDIATLERSIRAILARHEALRTRFLTVDGQPIQVVDEPDEGWRLRVEDLTGTGADRAGAGRRLLDEESTTPFDLAQGPPLRCLLVKLSDTEHLLGVTIHHIVSDARSIVLFVRELSALYQAGGDVDRADLSALPVQYRDYAVWQRARLVGEELERQLSYWRRHLAGAPPVLALPTIQRRSTSQGAGADRIKSALSREETASLHDLCGAHGVTPFMALFAALATVLGRWSGQSDVVIGVPLSGRNHGGTEDLIGTFLNVLPFRVHTARDLSFADLLGRVRQLALDGFAHGDAPFDVLIEDLKVARDPRRTPLFEVVLNVIASPEAEQVAGLVVEPMETPSLFSRFDLSVTAQQADDVMGITLDFATDRCDPAMLTILVDHVRALLRAAARDPARGLLDYPFPAPEPETGPGRPASPRVVDRPARGARTAVIDADGQWSYGWLWQATDRVAAALRRRDLPDAGPVALVRRPVAAFVAAVLGCRGAGVPFSVVEPGQAGASPVLDVSPGSGAPGSAIDLGAILAQPSDPDASVAAPEGAAGGWAADRFDLGGDDRFGVLSGAPEHLVSALSSAFHAGATLVVPDCFPGGDIDAVIAWLRLNAISVVYATAPILRALAARAPGTHLPALRYAFVDNTGELLPHDVEALRTLSPACRCVGLYRVDADGWPLAVYAVPDDLRSERAPLRIPLGEELPGAGVRLLLPSGKPAAIGEVGEIRTGSGPTGDLGRRWPDGSLELVRRAGADPTFDPLETVAALRDLPEVRDAVACEAANPDGGSALWGYVAGPADQRDAVTILNHLRTRLPAYLVPERLFVLDELPRTARGDYDLAALPAGEAAVAGAEAYVAPRTPMELRLTGILQELLNVDRIGVHDSFFELGGFSLLATQLTTRIRTEFEVGLALRDVFESPTVDELAQLIIRIQGELSGMDTLEALLTETEKLDAGTPSTDGGPQPPTAGGETSAAYERAVARLRESAVFGGDKPDETPETSARALWYAAAGTPRPVARAELPLPPLSPAQEDAFDRLLTRRVAGEPLAYLTGRASFLGLEFLTGTGALIPRRETELLGGAALDLAREIADAGSQVRILDLGTGTGNLGVSLAVHEPRARVWACDLEADAVTVARRNAEFHEVSTRVSVAQGDLFAALDRLSPRPGPFDLIVCNPPYLPSQKVRGMPVEVGGFEPSAAFDGGDVGLSILYRLIAEAPRHLVPGGWVCFELGAGMGRVLEKRLAARGSYGEVRKLVDQDGMTRTILARRLS
jgi:HemK-like putative methylase